MSKIRFTVLMLLIFTGINASFSQQSQSNISVIQKIDSISKTMNIETGIVKILVVDTRFDKVVTNTKWLTKKSKFYFDGPFLVIENKYFNMDKLMYFTVKSDAIEFSF